MESNEKHDFTPLKGSRNPKDIKYGDIIIFQYDKTNCFIKKVIGLPGDIIGINQGKVYRNGSKIKEEFKKEAMKSEEGKMFFVPEGKYFVISFFGMQKRKVSHLVMVQSQLLVQEIIFM